MRASASGPPPTLSPKMGADQSRAGGRRGAEGSAAAQVDGSTAEDLYEILQVDPFATAEEIKKAFRKQALLHHPDKNHSNVEAATKKFAQIQHAYEVLSDEDERAFYDRHREDLLNGDAADDDFDPSSFASAQKPPPPRQTHSSGLTAKQLFKFADPSLWKNDFSDSPTGFFSLFNSLFSRLAAEEASAAPLPGEPPLPPPPLYPEFGASAANYDEPFSGHPAAKGFYSAWVGFSTRKSFLWVEPFPIPPSSSAAADRRLRRLAERENSRARDAARREYNDAVRSLISFIKRRDPRWKRSDASDPEKVRAKEQERIKRELKESAEKRAKEREEMAGRYQDQSWQRQRPIVMSSGEGSDEDELEGEVESEAEARIPEEYDVAEDETESEEEAAIDDWYCAACGKGFGSQGAWDNHERSKKHKQAAFRLRKQMLAEDVLLSLSTPQEASTLSPPESCLGSPPAAPAALPQTRGSLLVERAAALTATGSDQDLALQMAVQESMDALDLNLQDAEEQAEVGLGGSAAALADGAKRTGKGGRKKRKGVAIETEVVSASEDSDVEAEGAVLKKGRRGRKGVSNDGSGAATPPQPMMATSEGMDGEVQMPEPRSRAGAEEVTSETKPELSKREKRRAKEAAKKVAQANGSGIMGAGGRSESCHVCAAKFASRTKLFEHIRATRHEHITAVEQVKKKGKRR